VVWVTDAEGSAPRRAAVRTGLTDGTVTEVLGGLEEGAFVVVGTERSNAPRRAATTGGLRGF
jgi:hypothetical protein